MENTKETLTLNVSRMLTCLPTLRIQSFPVGSEKYFAVFLFAHPSNTVSNIGTKCFCINVFSFALAFKVGANEKTFLQKHLKPMLLTMLHE